MPARIGRGDESRLSFIGSCCNDLEDWAKFAARGAGLRPAVGSWAEKGRDSNELARQYAYPTKIGVSRIVNEERFTCVQACLVSKACNG